VRANRRSSAAAAFFAFTSLRCRFPKVSGIVWRPLFLVSSVSLRPPGGVIRWARDDVRAEPGAGRAIGRRADVSRAADIHKDTCTQHVLPVGAAGIGDGGRTFAVSERWGRVLRMLGPIEARTPQRNVVAIDLLVVLWTAVWLVLGISVGTFVGRLGAVGEGLEGMGDAIHRAADAVGGLSDTPLVGEGFATTAQEIHGIGSDTVQRGRSIEHDVDRLALLIGAGLAAGPTLPVLAVWVPRRVARERERRALRRSLRRGDGAALAYLANRAVASRSFRELQSASEDPVADLAAGRHEALASLELGDLGLRRSARLVRSAGHARGEPSGSG
jgi:hypothetical protein